MGVVTNRRPSGAADADFVAGLLQEDASTGLLALPVGIRDEMVALQVRAREAHIAQVWPDAVEWIVGEEPDAGAVGRLVIAEVVGGWHIVDLRIHPRRRGRGLGAACLTDLAEEADRCGRCLYLTVAAGNPARRLYERVGFTRLERSRDDEEAPTDLWMKRLPTTRTEAYGQA